MELFRDGKFSYSILTPESQDAALIVLARSFITEPLSYGLGEARPEMKAHLHDWVQFTEPWMDHCTSSGLSVVAVDTETGHLAGVLIVKVNKSNLGWCNTIVCISMGAPT